MCSSDLFGIARLQNRDASGAPLLGTPAYWCPEQILGKPQNARSDLFSLGVVFYEMVTGQRPFEGQSLQSICGQILSATPLPPSHANPSAPAALDAILGRCLAKDPLSRYATCDELAAELYPLARRKAVNPQALTPPPVVATHRRLRLF